MKNKLFFGCLALATLFAQTSCEDYNKEYLDDYSTILYFTKSGEVPVTLYKTGSDTDYSINVYKAGSANDASTKASVTLMNEAELAIYNAENSTSYVLMPTSGYEITESTELTFGKKEMNKTVGVRFHTDVIDTFEDKEYVLGFSLVSNDSVNLAKKYSLIKPQVVIPSVYFTKTGLHENTINDEQDQLTFTLPITLPIENQWDFECGVTIDQQALDEYNAANKTTYSLLPSSSYTIDSSVAFTSKDDAATVTLVVDRKKLGYGDYVLPVRLSSCTMEAFTIDTEADLCLVGVSYLLPEVNLTVDMLSTNAQEPSEGSLAAMLDGNVDTYFHSAWSVSVEGAHYFEVALKTPINVFSFNYTTRSSNGNANPIAVEVLGSKNGTDFVSIVKITDNLPVDGKATYNSSIYNCAEPYSYLRFSAPDGNKTGGAWFVFSEFNLFGN
ncbi:MAG: DUF1735 domain-containing protein [Bacteroidales bacterium]|nr:DUF1735 domain-containing protein [Bacteroidales bacterium]